MSIAYLRKEEKDWLFCQLSYYAYKDLPYIHSRTHELPLQPIYIHYVEDWPAEAYVFVFPDDIVLSFRGTEITSPLDIMADLWFKKSESFAYSGQAHSGFRGHLLLIWDQIENCLRLYPEKNVWLCGHSLGGAMATIAAAVLNNAAVGLYTYGSPRVGDATFEQALEVPHRRFVNNNDAVPKVPFAWTGYQHHGELCYLNHWGNFRDCTLWQRTKDRWRRWVQKIKRLEIFSGVVDHSVKEYSGKLHRKINHSEDPQASI